MTNSDNEQKDDWSRYGKLVEELWSRTIKPARHPEYVFYFIVAMLIIGPLNIWMEYVKYLLPEASAAPLSEAVTAARLSGLRSTILTFFPAIATGAALQLVVAENGKPLRVVAIFLGVIIGCAAYVLFQKGITDIVAIKAGVVTSIISLWIWWVANSKQADLFDNPSPDDPVGGNTTRALPGSIKGISV